MYKIYYNDNNERKEWIGGNYLQSNWNKIPDKKIVKIIYQILNKEIILEGFESYNHLVDFISFCFRPDLKMKPIIRLLAYDQKDYIQVSINLNNNKIQTNTIIDKDETVKKYTGWKQGQSTKSPSIIIKEV